MRERKPNRLTDYDYSQNGYYFVTLCAKDKREFFGSIAEGKMDLNKYGEIVNRCWYELPVHYLNCSSDAFVVMPNHLHGIIVINNEDAVGNGLKPFPTHGLSEIMRGFKTFSSRRINEIKDFDKFQWQKSFYDHIVRDEESLRRIREYICFNPLKWEMDIENRNSHFPHENCADYYEGIITGGQKKR